MYFSSAVEDFNDDDLRLEIGSFSRQLQDCHNLVTELQKQPDRGPQNRESKSED